MGKPIFISYTTADREWAMRIRRHFEARHTECWIAPEDIPPGGDYASSIPDAISDCKVFILIFSKKTQNSEWVPKELSQAIDEHKLVIPIQIEEFNPDKKYRFLLKNIQIKPIYSDESNILNEITEEVLKVTDPFRGLFSSDKTGSSDRRDDFFADLINKYSGSNTKPINRVGSGSVTGTAGKKTTSVSSGKTAAPRKTNTKRKPVKKKRIRNVKKIVVCVLIALIAAEIIGFAGVKIYRYAAAVSVCGEKFKRGSYSVELTDKTLTDPDISELASMQNLTALTLTRTKLSFLHSRLTELTNLRTLKIEDCALSDDDIRQVMRNSQHLSSFIFIGSGEETVDLQMFCAETGSDLTALALSNVTVRFAGDMENFPKLTDLSLKEVKIAEETAVALPETVTSLEISDSGLTDIGFVSSLPELNTLNVSGNELTSLEGLENGIWLKNLDAGYNRISDISGLTNATQLETVILISNDIADASVLAKSAEKITELNIAGNLLTDASFLNGMTVLSDLNLSGNRLTALDVTACASLETLVASYNELTEVTGLEEKTFWVLLLDNNRISELPPLTFRKDYTNSLNVSGNLLKDDLFIPDGVKFSDVDMDNNFIFFYDRLYSLKAENVRADYRPGMDFDKIKTDGSFMLHLANCPLDAQAKIILTLGSRVEFVENEKSFVLND